MAYINDETRLGNTINFPGMIPAGTPDPSDPTGVATLPTTGYPNYTTCLLEAKLSELAPEQGFVVGSWVLAIDALPLIWPPVVPGPPPQQVCPLVVRASFGSGAASHTIEFNAAPSGALQLPGETVRVELFWDELPAIQHPTPATSQWAVPQFTRVSGTLYRGTIDAAAHRSFFAVRNEQDSLPPGGDVAFTFGTIPNFARSVMVYGTEPAKVYAANNFFVMSDSDTNLLTDAVDHYSGPEMLAIKNFGARIPVPGTARYWELATVVSNTSGIIVIDFEVGL